MKVLQIDISWTNYVQVANDLNVSSVQIMNTNLC